MKGAWGQIVSRIAVFVVALAYFLSLRDYGFQVEDEGTVLFQIARVLSGQRPYIDFHTGYAPGYWAIASFLFDAVGRDVNVLRTVLALINASTVLLIHEIASRAVGARWAFLPSLGWLASIPVVIGDFASFNVPYPAWFATLAWLIVALAILSWARSGATSALIVTGITSAIAFSIKPNAGAYALAASAWVVSALAIRTGNLDRVAAVAAGGVMLLGVWTAFGFRIWGADAAIHLPVILALAALWTLRPAACVARPGGQRVSTALALLAVSFLVPTAIWVFPLLIELGPARFASEVLFVGSEAADIYYVAPPRPTLWGAVVALTAFGVGVVGYLMRAGVLRLRSVLAAGVALAVVGGGYLVRTALMPEGFLTSVSLQLENAAFLLATGVHGSAIAYLHFDRRRRGSRRTRLWLYAISPLAAAMYLQLYPRTDYMHLVLSIPLTAVVATVMLRRVMAWWSVAIGARGQLIVGAGLAMVAIFAIGVRIWPALEPVRTPAGARDEIHITEGLDVWLEPAASDDLRALSMVIDYVDRRTGDGEPVFAFPAVGAVLFGAGVSNPTNHDYWYAGFPDRSVEAETLQRLRVLDPRYIVTLNDGWAWFMESPPYFTEMHEYAVKNYSLEARFGRYDVLGRKGEFSADEQVFWQAPGGRRDILQRVNGRRRQAVRRWMEGLTPAEAREAVLPARPSDILLLLRALRDGGDLRTLGWLTQGMAHPDTRIWQEALFATELVVSRFYASTNRWANDLDVTGYFAYLEPHVGAAIDTLSRRTEQRVLERREEGARELLRRALAAVSAP